MQTKNSTLRILLTTVLLLLGLLTMGQSERKLAKEFVAQASKISIRVKPPLFLYKYNLKTGIFDSISYQNKREKDSLLWVHSRFIQHIVDSVFIQDYMKGYTRELKKYGMHVVTKSKSDNNTYTASVSQIMLEEQYYFFSDTAYYGRDVYVHHQFLNALDVSSWFLLHGPLLPGKSGKILFAENLLTDNIDGHFDINPYSGNVEYLYQLDSLTVKKIYTYAQNLGRAYAGYTFDYLLNTFLNKYIPASRRTKRYWRYDPYRKRFFFAMDDRFVPMQNSR
ncbi:hypothetical protein MNBD_BACTEROID07-1190 [hydrothermal vent metagenome]|uniref:Uncharacterized protein n=1 Tax=hydrothermal vent metagenome TaxID=652676 RepID=A0A3B0UPZ7_9ZZZZ